MSVLVADCPECKAQQIAMSIAGYDHPKQPGNQRGPVHAHMMGICSRCEKPSLYVLDVKGTATWGGIAGILSHARNGGDTNNLSASNYDIERFYVRQNVNAAPEHLPEDVLKAFQQGETNYELEGHEEAAATMYRRSLERALKFAHPEIPGALAAKIKALVAGGVLPQAMGDWANEIRIIGNDGAHDEEVSHEDLKAARMFCDSFLRYVITLPKEIAIRRGTPI